jgi:7tm Chemosensory receptor
MFSFEARDIYDVIAPLHFFSKVYGLTSFAIKRNKEKFEASISWFNIICILVLTFWSIGLSVLMYLDLPMIEEIHYKFVGSVILLQAFMSFMFAYVGVSLISSWWYFAHNGYFATILNLTREVDEELSIMCVPVDLKKHKKFVFLFIIALKLFLVSEIYFHVMMLETYSFYRDNVFMLWTMNFTVELSVFEIIHFTFWMWIVELRYKQINLFLRRNFLESSDQAHRNKKEFLIKVASLHDKLVDVTETINRCYGVPVSSNGLFFGFS